MKRIALAVVLVFAACAALAAGQWIDLEKRFTPEQMRATGLDTLTAEQLATLNRLLRDEAPAAAPAPEPVRDAAPPPDESRLVGFNDEPIVTTLVGTLEGWAPGTEFEFANGQRWKVLKGSYTLPKPLEAPKVKLVPGVMGRWFFRVDDDTPGARVYRID